ncbi:MAG TPA: hypothetical protein VIV65_05740 [Gemmatimonadaceae bacterium]
MSEEKFERLMKDAAETFRRPPEAPLAEMWASIDAETFGTPLPVKRQLRLTANPWLRMAAVLVLGIALGRGSTLFNKSIPATKEPVATPTTNVADNFDLTTERYLVQTASLLVQLPSQLQNGKADTAFVSRASKSLVDLRLLMDSPAAANPRMRSLFEDLELVLVQVVQMPKNGSRMDANLIRQAMQERDVMPRLRDAVAETPNN